MKENTSIERVVGNVSESRKQEIMQEQAHVFDEQKIESLLGYELEKTEEQEKLTRLANEKTNALLRKYGVDAFDVPSKNVHITEDKIWTDSHATAAGIYSAEKQAAVIRETPSLVGYYHSVVHELIHFKSYAALMANAEEGNETIMGYRVGLKFREMDAAEGKQGMQFVNLNEAVTEELTKRILINDLDLPIFKSEYSATKDYWQKYPNMKDSHGELLFEEGETVAARSDQSDRPQWRKAFGRVFSFLKREPIVVEKLIYRQERDNVNMLIDELHRRYKDEFTDREGVFDMFAKGMIMGHLLSIGRLVDKTFGVGTFRKLSELDHDVLKQREFIKGLKNKTNAVV